MHSKSSQSPAKAKVLLGMQPTSGSLILEESAERFSFRVGNRNVSDQVSFDGLVSLEDEGHQIDKCFGPGYMFNVFDSSSSAALICPTNPSNAALIVTKKNSNIGRMYQVEGSKAFKLERRSKNTRLIVDESSLFESQEHEVSEVRRILQCWINQSILKH